MKWMLSAVVFAMILGGVFSKSVAQDSNAVNAQEQAGANKTAEGAGPVEPTSHNQDTSHGTNHNPTEGSGPTANEDVDHAGHGAPGEHAEGAHGGKHSIGVKQPEMDKTRATTPGTVIILEPKALAKVAGAVTLKWQPAANAEVYHVQVAKDPRFKWLVVNEHNVSGDSFQVPTLEAGQYFWQVAARKPGNDASWTKGYFTKSSFEVR